MEERHKEHGRTVAFRVPNNVWAEVDALMRERNERASVILREILSLGLAAQRDGQRQTTGGRHEHGD